MFRNKKLRHSTCWIVGLGMVLTIVVSRQSILLAVITGMVIGIITFIHLLYSWQRYKEMERLSLYLQKMAGGVFSLDVRDNDEGELSILKNEIYKMTQMLSEKTVQADESKVKLAEALADVSHQLKTPLTAMTVMTDLLAQEDVPKEKKEEFLGNVSSQLIRMEWLVTSLLKLSKIDAGAITFSKEPVEVQRLVDETISPLAFQIQDKQLAVKKVGDYQAKIVVDVRWTKEALINIVKNAVEHTDTKGVITISVTDTILYTEIAIHNSGEPIKDKDLPHIFKRFYQGSNAQKQSVGIGLALSYHIVTKQEGAIHVESASRKGTVFTVRFYHHREHDKTVT
ncbi:sensor histidine kinase [Shouchella lehensis]|uniref:histidine kinase n=1 Tax=Shouchella lehensis TaxID=300825 RepID=A0A4Y7WEP0_9BACI|nr:HAMP domain-containing sensor histidine kinase [Shouchella lehensis]MBG9784857.1 hypothetical protein [Shouchella lehensis]RQW18548.1 sensor histidine kinase [Bacillus sp. C1-1]TES46269.1 HAMP domain-containing histidine kinase [Shouchella lehensis]